MFYDIKKKLEANLASFLAALDKQYGLKQISPILSRSIKEFILRKGKRIRPILFIIGYLGFSKNPKPGLYQSALAIELLHDFMLIHDDIIDKSDTRRGKPSMHVLLNRHIRSYKNIKFNGQDLSIVAGDVIYAMAIEAFLSIKEDWKRKEAALRRFIQAAVFTGAGEFIEILAGGQELKKVSRETIYKIYDYKTSFYTFATPLASGAILAGAPSKQIDRLARFGMLLGRAFQIKDDILGMFGDEERIGKSTLTDLQEAKKTYLVWHAFQHAGVRDKRLLAKILTKKKVTTNDLAQARRIVAQSGSLTSAKKEIEKLVQKSRRLIASSKMRKAYRQVLLDLTADLLKT